MVGKGCAFASSWDTSIQELFFNFSSFFGTFGVKVFYEEGAVRVIWQILDQCFRRNIMYASFFHKLFIYEEALLPRIQFRR